MREVELYDEEELKFALDNDIINDWEYKFYLSIYNYNSLSDKQGRIVERINEVIAIALKGVGLRIVKDDRKAKEKMKTA